MVTAITLDSTRDRSLSGSSARSSTELRFERWVSRRLGEIGHEQRVAATAARLFDLTANRHQLPPYFRRLLRLAALVHDVGRAVEDDRHPMIGAKMVLADTWLPVRDTERRALAYLVRYHRGAVPDAGMDAILDSADNAPALRTVLALLRAADALDSRQLSPPHLSIRRRGRRLFITCRLNEDSAKARRVYRRRKKFRLLREELDLKVTVDVIGRSLIGAA